MTKADIVSEIAKSTGVEKVQVQAIVEAAQRQLPIRRITVLRA